ncbi:MAG TPA: hypothetical protein ENK05_10890 [Gammaproteobacteria bacterium]|nr:hypothetical protein [Gammaproteobacteria bacterium]
MKTGGIGIGLILASAASLAPAQGFYAAATAGLMDADIDGYDPATNAGVLLGYEFFRREIVYLSAEAEFTTTLSDGDLDHGGRSGHWDIDSRAAYLAARVGERFYLKVRYGVSWTDVGTRFEGRSRSSSDSSGSWGGALGFNFSDHWGVQADGVLVDPDVTYWNLGAVYRF